jgi:hypothetical protein
MSTVLLERAVSIELPATKCGRWLDEKTFYLGIGHPKEKKNLTHFKVFLFWTEVVASLSSIFFFQLQHQIFPISRVDIHGVVTDVLLVSGGPSIY